MFSSRHGYDFDNMEDGVDWSRAVPTVSGRTFLDPKLPPKPPLTEHERAIEELRAMNMNTGFIMTFPLPEDTPVLPGSGDPHKAKAKERQLHRHPFEAGAPAHDRRKADPKKAPSGGRKKTPSQQQPQAPQLGPYGRREAAGAGSGGGCAHCGTPRARYCPQSGQRHPPPSASPASSSSASPGPSLPSAPASASSTPQRGGAAPASLSPSPSRYQQLVEAQLREEEIERALFDAAEPSPGYEGTPPPAHGRRSGSEHERRVERGSSSPPPPPAAEGPPEPARTQEAGGRVGAAPPARRPAAAAGRPTTPGGAGRNARRGASEPPFAVSQYRPPAPGAPRQQQQQQRGAVRNSAGEWELTDFSYENLLGLGSMAVCTGLSKAQLAGYKPAPYPGTPAGVVSEDCIICLDELQPGDPTLRIVCKHIFHHSCIVEWLAKANRCPTCRFEVPRKEKIVV
ncbi:E3 ubiquitin-protein ligase RING1-like [Diplonema papillatum]|nr:E3 ubiquitin-protein ligase RING1-like [Diplonema papillatum]